jgi:hypothetical protein
VGNLPLNLDLSHTQTQWASQLNPIVNNPILQGRALSSIILIANTPLVVNHGLGRNMQGWFVTDQQSSASIFRTQPFNSLTLTLESPANVTINVWVY